MPSDVTYNRLAIDHDFRTITTFTSPLANPLFMATADFTGNGVVTPWAVGPGGYYTSVLTDGVAALGPGRWCSAGTPTARHADFDFDRRADAVLSYTDGCADHGNGVVVVQDNGNIQQLELDPTGRTIWRIQVGQLGDDRFPDIRTQNLTTDEVNYFHGTGTGTFVRGPDANTDSVQLAKVKPVAIDVLANDYASSEARVVITVPPRYGTVRVLSDRRVLYTPGSSTAGPTASPTNYRDRVGDPARWSPSGSRRSRCPGPRDESGSKMLAEPVVEYGSSADQ
ncbi:Ig-like domain-containing protein [Plantactinospora veratri]